ncbi:hypothetical protein ACFFGH_32495 [Lysobacter korlensis]|uniref:Uncharacterized protein n=1 Tax=Lysobacter korlensis TaxID=553636 RepID=A0ABV6S012_9GAMM
MEGEPRWQSLERRFVPVRRGSARGVVLSLALALFATAGLLVPSHLGDQLPFEMQGFDAWAATAAVTGAIAMVALLAYMRKPDAQTRPRTAAAGGLLALLIAVDAILLLSAHELQSAREAMPDAEMSVQDGIVTIRGEIGPNFARDLHRLRKGAGPIERIDIDSHGGLVDQALLVADQLKAWLIPVRVTGTCASACAIVWSGARQREMVADAVVGLHLGSLIDGVSTEFQSMSLRTTEPMTQAALKEAGFSARLLKARSDTPADGMHWVSAYELMQEGVRFRPVDARGLDASHEAVLLMGDALRRDESMPAVRRLLMAYAQARPEDVIDTVKRLRAAQLEGDAAAVAREGAELVVGARLHAFAHAPGDDVVQWGREIIGQLGKVLDERDENACSTYLAVSEEPDPEANARRFAAIARLMESAVDGIADAPSAWDRSSTQAVVTPHYARQALTARTDDIEAWPPLSRCRMLHDVYVELVQLPTDRAAAGIRLMEGVQ